MEEIYRETATLKKLDHRNIVTLYRAFVDKKQVIMLMEYVSDGELLSYVDDFGPLSEVVSRKFFSQIINAMSYCHNRGIIHRDLKLENILVKSREDMTIKIVDFGIAGVCVDNKKERNDCGSLTYMAPEVTNKCLILQGTNK